MNVRDVLRQLGVRFWEHGQSPLVTGGWVGIVCERCDGGKGRPGLGIHVRTLKTSCWRCGGQSLAKALSDSSGRPFAEVAALLGGVLPDRAPVEKPTGKFLPPPGVGPMADVHKRYLRGRGFDPDEMEALWGLKGIGRDGGRFAWRIFIPVRDEFGADVSWTTRAVGDVPHGFRYRGAKREESLTPRSECLGGIEHVRGAAVVTEGFFSAARVGPGAVWTAGVGYSKGQILKLARIPSRTILFDSEPAAQARARKLAEQLAVFGGETHIAEVSSPDPAEAPADEIEELRRLFL